MKFQLLKHETIHELISAKGYSLIDESMKLRVLILVLSILISCCKQDLERTDINWLKQNAHEIKSIDPSELDFGDLQALKNAIGDSRIVLLGEAEHGDGSTFLLKSRIVKYLHTELGFGVLAFESPFFGINSSWEKYLAGKKKFSDVNYYVYDMWKKSEACQDLFGYIERSQRSRSPLILTGIDSRHAGDLSPVNNLDSLFSHYKLNIPKNDMLFFSKTLRRVLEKEYSDSLSKSDQDKFINLLALSMEELSKTDVDKFWIQELKNLQGYAMHSWHCVVDREKEFYNNSYRDAQMADNLIWLLNEKYKGQKIVVWAANMHTVKNYSAIDTATYPKEEIEIRQAEHSLGEYLVEKKQDVCSIITIAYGGKGADFEFKEYVMDTVHRNSMEAMMHKVGYKYGYVILNDDQHWSERNRILNSGFYGKAINVALNSTCDVILFIDEMKPNTKLKPQNYDNAIQ